MLGHNHAGHGMLLRLLGAKVGKNIFWPGSGINMVSRCFPLSVDSHHRFPSCLRRIWHQRWGDLILPTLCVQNDIMGPLTDDMMCCYVKNEW